LRPPVRETAEGASITETVHLLTRPQNVVFDQRNGWLRGC